MAGKAKSPSERRLTPLWIVSLFLGLTETVLGVAATQTTGAVQSALTIFVVLAPILVGAAFFAFLWNRPWVFYAPSEYGSINPAEFIKSQVEAQTRKLVTKTADLGDAVKVVGSPDNFTLLFKAVSGRWSKSTKAMDVGEGCVVQVTTEHWTPDGARTAAEALTFVPDVEIVPDGAGGHRLVPKVASP